MSNALKSKKELTLEIFNAIETLFKDLKEAEIKLPDIDPLRTLATKLNVGGGVKIIRIRKDNKVLDKIVLI